MTNGSSDFSKVINGLQQNIMTNATSDYSHVSFDNNSSSIKLSKKLTGSGIQSDRNNPSNAPLAQSQPSATTNFVGQPPEAKPPIRNQSKGQKKLIAPIDHEKQRQKLQEIMEHLMQNEGEENKDLQSLYESLNPNKKSLNPLEYQARQKAMQEKKHSAYGQHQLAAISRKESAPKNNGIRVRGSSKGAQSANSTSI